MNRRHHRRIGRGLTLIEILVAISLLGVLLALGAPAFGDMIMTARMRAVAAQYASDVQLARRTSVSRNTAVIVIHGANPSMTCYAVVLYSNWSNCDCTTTPVCTDDTALIRAEQIPRTNGVTLTNSPATPILYFTPSSRSFGWSGGLFGVQRPGSYTTVQAGNGKSLNIDMNDAGRVAICAPAGSGLPEPAC